jgi:hypothetical protein
MSDLKDWERETYQSNDKEPDDKLGKPFSLDRIKGQLWLSWLYDLKVFHFLKIFNLWLFRDTVAAHYYWVMPEPLS